MIKSTEDIEVVWAQRQDRVRGVLKFIRIMMLAVQKHASHMEQSSQVSAPQLWAMWELMRAPGLRVHDLAKTMAVNAATIRTMMTDLEDRGLVRSVSSGESPNAARLSLSETGRQVLDAAPGPAQGVVFAALEKLDDDDLEQLLDALQPLVAAMEHTDGAAAHTPLADLLNNGGIHIRPHSL